jgi:hypothetical protein
MTTYATSGTDEDGTMWVSPGGPEHLTMLRDELKGVRELLPLGGVPTAEQARWARALIQCVIFGLESAAGIDEDEDEEAS